MHLQFLQMAIWRMLSRFEAFVGGDHQVWLADLFDKVWKPKWDQNKNTSFLVLFYEWSLPSITEVDKILMADDLKYWEC